jgi:hypothetical protein
LLNLLKLIISVFSILPADIRQKYGTREKHDNKPEYKDHWSHNGEKLQGFIALAHMATKLRRIEFCPSGLYRETIKWEELEELDGNKDKILKEPIRDERVKSIINIGETLVKDLTELGWNGDVRLKPRMRPYILKLG